MADETIILKVEVDNSAALAQLEENKLAIIRLKDEQKELNRNRKQMTDKEYASELVRTEQLLKSHTNQYNKLSHEIQGTKSFTDKLKDSFNQNSAAADKLTGGLASSAQGIIGMTKASLAFITTPIGAVVAALGAAIGALTAYFKGSEEGQNKWNKIISVGSALLEKLMDIVEDIGGLIFRVFTEPQKVIQDFINLISKDLSDSFKSIKLVFRGLVEGDFGKMKEGFTLGAEVVARSFQRMKAGVMGFVESINEAVVAGERMADLNAAIDKNERDLLVERAKTSLEVSKLRREAITQEGDTKRATIEEAIALEEALSEKEVEHAQLKLELAEQELKTNGDDKEAKDKVAQATAALINAEASRYDATLRFSKEIEALDDAEAKRREKMRVDQLKREEEAAKKRVAAFKAGTESIDKAAEESAQKQLKLQEDKAKIEQSISDSLTSFQKNNFKVVFDAQKINIGEGLKLLKAGAMKDTLAKAHEAAVNAMASASSVPFIGWLLGPVAFAATLATGLSSLASIAGISLGFAKGGYTGDGPKHRPAGIVHAGEWVAPQSMVKSPQYGPVIASLEGARKGFADGGLVTNTATQDIDTQFSIMRMMEKMPAPVIGIKEYTEASNRVQIKQSITSA